MKSIKMLGLAVGTALALTAFVGVSAASASATTLCKTNAAKCAQADQYPSGTQFQASLQSKTSLTLSGAGYGLTCSGSTLSGSTSAQSGEPLLAKISALTLAGCKAAAGMNCTFSAAGLPYSATFARNEEFGLEGASEGTLAASASGQFNPGIHYSCNSLGANCTYDFADLSLEVNGGSPATLVANEVPLVNAGLSPCAEEVTLSATYNVSTPSPLFVSYG